MKYFIDSDLNEDRHNLENKWRIVFVWLLVIFVFSFFFKSLFDLQIIKGEENLILARNISQRENLIRANRGVIYDENGEILAKNKASYSVYISPSQLNDQVKKDKLFYKLSDILKIDKEEIVSTYDLKINQLQYTPSNLLLFKDITYDQYLSILVNQDDLDGVYVIEEPIRDYPYKNYLSHILGYVASVNQKEKEEFNLDENAQIGKDGLERMYDDLLRGKDGILVKTYKIDSTKENAFVSQMPVDGYNIFTTIDINWQKKLFDLLQTQVDKTNAFAGVAIIMETKTGEIKAFANIPSFDNNLFAKGITNFEYTTLLNDEKTPLLNRAIALQLPVGSIFKPMVAATALQEGAISESTKFKSGCVELPQYKLCEADHVYLGTMTVIEGLGRSSNVFFCKTALKLVEKANGIRTLIKYTDQFGIGHKTGIDLPGEQAGTMASPELKKEKQNEPWYLADICNTAIGQGLVTATPIQMVSVAQIIGNNGDFYRPHFLKRVVDQDGNIVKETNPELVRHVNVDKKYFEIIKKGMRYAVNGSRGSAWLLRGVDGDPYAKTGSAEATEYRNGKKVDGAHSWVIGGFNYEGVDYNFVIHLQEGGRGYKAVPVIRDFIQWLYS